MKPDKTSPDQAVRIQAESRTFLADLQTPVGIYLKVRDLFPESALLESSDYHTSENSYSFIGIEPIARFALQRDTITEQYPDGRVQQFAVDPAHPLSERMNRFLARFDVQGDKGRINGLFGYTAYDCVSYFESVGITKPSIDEVPQMVYILYRYVIAVNHLRGEMTVTENRPEGSASGLDRLMSVLQSKNFPSYDFHTGGGVSSPITDEQYKEMVRKGIGHCLRGDVFQIVLSRKFMQEYRGDDFKVYRALRSINPSPYLFYFDFGSYRIFGSSPETHLKIEGDTATIDPIAGTFRRTGDDAKDRELALRLLDDPKENAEHVMLVDLARNDLNRNTTGVYVKSYKEIQFYSHVIHMVSRVCGRVASETNRIRLFADTFPAGTLSGAPKVRAMQLIDQIESHARGIYGGCIGYIGFEQAWMDKLTTNAPHLKVFDTSKGIDVIHETGHNHGDHHHEGGIEPHIWNSARNASVIARNIYSALSELDSANEPYFKHRLDSLQQIIAQTDTDVRDRLQNADTTFLIYHPALSYFARDYGLKQISIEEGGKEPSPAHLKELIETCRRDNARVIFVQQEFDTRNARLIADELGVTVVPINPLSYEWREEMITVANALAK